mgnify:CR=1 FL=1
MHIVGQLQMTEDDGATAHGAMRADCGATGHPDTTSHCCVLAYMNIVSNLYQVIQLDAVLNHRIFNGAPVNTCVRPDFHIVTNQYATKLFNLYPLLLVKRKAKTIGTDHHACMKNAVFTNNTPGGNGNPGFKPTAGAYGCAAFHHAQRADAGRRMYDGSL